MMNDATKEITMARAIQGPLLGHNSVGNTLRPSVLGGYEGQRGTANFDLPGYLPVWVNQGATRGRRGESSQYIRQGRHGGFGRFVSGYFSGKRGTPRWHKLAHRWPDTFCWTLTCGLGAAIIEAVQVILH